jgi:hypothetical protein
MTKIKRPKQLDPWLRSHLLHSKGEVAIAVALISSATAFGICFLQTHATARAAGIEKSVSAIPAPEVKRQVPTPPAPRKSSPSAASSQPAADPLRVAIDKFEDYDAAHPEINVAVKKEDDPHYLSIWQIKMTMLGSIEDLAKSLHREKEVESLVGLKHSYAIVLNTAPLHWR